MTTFYDATLAINAADMRGNALPVPPVTVTPAALSIETGGAPYKISFDLASTAGPVQLSMTTPGFGSLPDTALDIQGDTSFTYYLPPVDEQIVNGEFETADLNGWNILGDGATISVPYHTGQSAAMLMPGTGSSSSLSQSVTIGDNLQQPTLSFLYNLPENSSNDEFTVKVTGDHELDVLTTQSVSEGWTHAWADLSSFSGQTVTLSLQLTGTSSSVYLDEISMGSWTAPQVTSASPQSWQAADPQIITISGQNFTGLPKVYLNDIELSNVQFISPTEIITQTPTGLLGGYYHLRVVNPDGAENDLAEWVPLQPLPVYLPAVYRPGAQINHVVASDYPTLGFDAQHSGYSPNKSSVSRYSKVWSTQPMDRGYWTTHQVMVAEGVALVVVDGYQAPYELGIYAYDIDTGKELWNYPVSVTYEVSQPTIANGVIYFQAGKYSMTELPNLVALDLHTGLKLWQVSLLANSFSFWNPLVVGQNIYLTAGSNPRMYILNATTGVQVGYAWLSEYKADPPAYVNGELYNAIDGYFIQYDPDDGAIIWKIWVSNDLGNTVSPVIAGRTGFYKSSSYLSAINLDTHTICWQAPVYSNNGIPAVNDGVIYFINSDTLVLRDATTGDLLNSFRSPSRNYLENSLTITSAAIYIADSYHTYMLDPNTLQVIWSVNEGGVLTVADGYLFIAHQDGFVSAYRAEEP